MAAETATKPIVTLGGVALAASSAIVWRFQAGTVPYQTVMQVHESQWNELKGKLGEFVDLRVVDSRGVEIVVKDLTILHTVPSPSPRLMSFVVADKRWKWSYKLIARQFNIPRKTGNRTALNTVPVEAQITVDQYQFLGVTLNPQTGQKWSPREAVESVLDELEGEDGYVIESWPIREQTGGEGEFSLQSVTLRDSGDVALSRLLSYIPGAEVYADKDGKLRVYDAADIRAAERLLGDLPPRTWDGEKPEYVQRFAIRPSEVVVHYERELEILFEFEDDWNQTSSQPGRDTPFLENVLPTVDPETQLFAYDPEINQVVPRNKVPAGTWVPVKEWLLAMEQLAPAGTLPWTFETIRVHWSHGDLVGVLGGAQGADTLANGNVMARIQALQNHFRQTFRVSRRYMERIGQLEAVRVAVLDPVTGARAPAAVWGQSCIIPNAKGQLLLARRDEQLRGMFRNLDFHTFAVRDGVNATAPGPQRVSIIDEELGIFRIETLLSPFGTDASSIPCNLVNDGQSFAVPVADMAQQDTKPMGLGMQIESGANGLFLSRRLKLLCMLTFVPAAPNNLRRFAQKRIKAADVSQQFRNEFRIQNGKGPELQVYVPPSEVTARYAWTNDAEARAVLRELLGLVSDNIEEAGIQALELPGYTLINDTNELQGHATAVAAEALSVFADSPMGRVASRLPEAGLKLAGNVAAATLQVAAAPSGKVMVLHDLPGVQRPISRLALMPESVRHLIYGVLDPGIAKA